MCDRAASIEDRPILRVAIGGEVSADRDAVVVEAPLELRSADGTPLAVIMRTPRRGGVESSGEAVALAIDDDLDLARGLLHAEGVLIDPAEAMAVGRPDPATLEPEEREHVVQVDLPAETLASRWPARSLAATSACGVCGKASIAALERRAVAVLADLSVTPERVVELPDRLRGAQRVFAATGGLHAAGLFTVDGDLVAIREDVGRHNAVDKLVGWALVQGRLPLSSSVLCVSGRLGFEIVQKAVVAGIPIVVAVSAPSSLAVDLAERFRVTVCGFARGGRFNIYSHPSRVARSIAEAPSGAV